MRENASVLTQLEKAGFKILKFTKEGDRDDRYFIFSGTNGDVAILIIGLNIQCVLSEKALRMDSQELKIIIREFLEKIVPIIGENSYSVFVTVLINQTRAFNSLKLRIFGYLKKFSQANPNDLELIRTID